MSKHRGERASERESAVGGRVHDVTLQLSSARTAVVSPERSLKSDAPSETQRYPGDLHRYSPSACGRELSLFRLGSEPLLGLLPLPFFIPCPRRARRCKGGFARAENPRRTQERARLKTR
ncbi:hypothetical protein QQF64_019822 [Cirrhinus molitorella]|uniref:Uncharacterized protein n=1 Tax=Cirrhinus molitorella TaxID=172907 RepID=A0ABR3LJ07_9TELE